jgi:ACS family allantoate permease-like MFS transporter
MVILGSFTVLFGICCFVFLVDNPKSKSLRLSYEQEQIADIRTLDNDVVVSKDVNYGQIMECLRESRYYCYVFASMFVNLQNGSIQTFCGIIVTNVGFSVRVYIYFGIFYID